LQLCSGGFQLFEPSFGRRRGVRELDAAGRNAGDERQAHAQEAHLHTRDLDQLGAGQLAALHVGAEQRGAGALHQAAEHGLAQ